MRTQWPHMVIRKNLKYFVQHAFLSDPSERHIGQKVCSADISSCLRIKTWAVAMISDEPGHWFTFKLWKQMHRNVISFRFYSPIHQKGHKNSGNLYFTFLTSSEGSLILYHKHYLCCFCETFSSSRPTPETYMLVLSLNVTNSLLVAVKKKSASW